MNIKIQEENEEEIVIAKLPIGKYSQLLTILKKILSQEIITKDLINLSDTQFIAKIPELIVQNLPDALEIVQLGTGLPKEKVEVLGLSEIIDLILAIIEANKYAQVYEKIKKVTTRLQPQKEIVTTNPTG